MQGDFYNIKLHNSLLQLLLVFSDPSPIRVFPEAAISDL